MKRFVVLGMCVFAFAVQAQQNIVAEGKVLDARTGKGIVAHIRYSSVPTGSIYGRFWICKVPDHRAG
jgi:hypothetical protein